MPDLSALPTRRYLIPPIHFALALVLVVAVRYALPVWSAGSRVFFGIGVALLAIGLVLGVGAHVAFRAQDLTVGLKETPLVLVRSGVFRISRNPMYLSMALMTAALALMLGQPLGVIFALALVWMWNNVFIPYEERILGDAFGSQYDEYRATVRRWV
jgi:protein-S-isoprenylcysteine O-methyltransferase Ste14